MHKKIENVDLRKKTETSVFAEFLSKVMPTVLGAPPPPPPPPPTPTAQKMRCGTQTAVTSPSVTATPNTTIY